MRTSINGLGSLLAKRDLVRYVGMAEQNKGTPLGVHYLRKAVEERTLLIHDLSPAELKNFNDKIATLETALAQ